MSKLALLSVSDKTGIVELAQALVQDFGFDLISSGGTAKTLQAAGLPVTKVSDYTGSPEILGGRVKTLHPRIHGGILARRDLPEHLAELEANQIRPLDLVVVNLYPFEQTIANPDVTVEDAIENIDIGGPTLLRAAAKNHAHLTVLCRPERYGAYLEELRTNGEPSATFRRDRALEGFQMTASYDRAIAAYFAQLTDSPAPFTLTATPHQTLRYGENPHQPATWYKTDESGWSSATQLQGKELSYNNLVDLEAARRIIIEFGDSGDPAAAVLKHTNPCGAAMGATLVEAYERAFNADSVSAFGGIVALNRPIDAPTAAALSKTFLECIVAPGCEPEAAAILKKKSKLRVLLLPDLFTGPKETVKAIAGGLLVQAADDATDDPGQWQVVTQKQPTDAERAEMQFAWKLAKHVKSNAIVITRDRTTIGVGAGQMNRVGAAQIALAQAGDAAKGACLASDGFFPFDDSVRTAAAAGITTIIQPGGSIRDNDSIAAADELGIVMICTGMRHFLH
ncbi:bifunctional phosphoribosylaminoimidazolecarboxamide formyltransferase/IMP cyclohydrolase [Spirulina major CS-329]|uniref:bifunctional phosphoribosylaminoimidazolecarboxamide formyltransferase/IMP cyclohydrolase n=1 Tax=Spirulina TaxID=1154 RepID=UPI00232CF147|nr:MULTISPECIES: bifunctional phosphoribosylaminoimidazolecarboxamide formyltransferase/IMP cyclohydrolase [Spirulina]MDB9495285.1 bifunctional phosphoribosylaminoimidazolecarboxamide formyltransferase/IMP cyclohydrolase [Spirulina subsalsa CS-330]MDB9503439.1 bifunctional phosphoribosylaminoimidazolecarboxamide formyltransferase/IMP cyclohydrolase [Spirulina major CS-329]